MNVFKIFLVLIVLVGCGFQSLLLAEDTDPEKDRAKLQAEIEHSLMAPCCWSMTVDQHESPAAKQVRQQIAELLDQGKTKKEILAYLSSPQQYGERILASPSSETFLGKSAYWLVPAAFVIGFLIVGVTIRRLARTNTPTEGTEAKEVAKPDPLPEDLEERVEQELKDYE